MASSDSGARNAADPLGKEEVRPLMTESLPPESRLGPVHLIVADLERSIGFYGGVLGLKTHQRDGSRAVLSVEGGRSVVALTEMPGAHPKPRAVTGLYHFAILVPQRRELARALQQLIDRGVPLQGAADHWVSEAIYLADPDGNGIEIYADRPRSEWPVIGDQLQMATEPLDVGDLMEEIGDRPTWEGLPAGTQIGHVHLHVGQLDSAEQFYRRVVGFDLMLHFGAQAAFLSVAGYHHHLGLNTWAGIGAPPPPPSSAGLRYFTILLPDSAALDAVAKRAADAELPIRRGDGALSLDDPSRNRVVFALDPSIDTLESAWND